MFLISLVAVLSAFAVVTRQREHKDATVHYVCPMHPEVVGDEPAQCPICRMALEPTTRFQSAAPPGKKHDAFSLSADVQTPHHSETGALARVHIFSEEIQAPAWLESENDVAAVLYADESSSQAPSEEASFSLAADPSLSAPVQQTTAPPLPWDATTVVVHFRVLASNARFRSGDVGWVRVGAQPRKALAIPYAAVIQTKDDSYVLIPAGDHRTFSRKRVELGKVVNGIVRVVSGLQDQERIATGDVFFLDAEHTLRTRPEAMTGTQR